MSPVELPGGPVRFHPNGTHPKWTWEFINKTGKKIHDFHFQTGLTDGDDPDLLHIKVKRGTDVLADQPVNDENEAHITLSSPIDDGQQFSITVKCDDYFEDDERIEICPTDEEGATIDRVMTGEVALSWPCTIKPMYFIWKCIREEIYPFTILGWEKGPEIEIRGKVKGPAENSEDGDYCFDVELCKADIDSVREQRAAMNNERGDGAKGAGVLHCEIIPIDQVGNPPLAGRFYRLKGQLRYDLGHGWWELHPVRSWQEIEPC